MVELVERLYLSRYSTQAVGFTLLRLGSPADADGDVVTAQMIDEADDSVVFTRVADKVATGQYAVTVTGADTASTGLYRVQFSYSVSGTPDMAVDFVEVGPPSPSYDALSASYRDAVEHVWVRFADLFDSPLGGPHLQTYAQSHFGRNRMAQLLRVALGRLNTIAQPRFTYSIDGSADFPFAAWGPLLEQALYVEVIKHLVRSYIEQPEVALASSVSRLDRRDYMQRWQELLALEERDLDSQLDSFRLEMMGVGNVSVLVSGGAYGRWGPLPSIAGGQAAARGYFPIRSIGW